MTIKTELLNEEPIILATMAEPMVYQEEIPAMFHEIIRLRDTLPAGPGYFTIVDVTAIRFGFSDMVYMLAESRIASRQRRDDLPNNLMLVGKGTLAELASKAMEQAQYGNYKMRLFTSRDEALAAARAATEESIEYQQS